MYDYMKAREKEGGKEEEKEERKEEGRRNWQVEIIEQVYLFLEQ